MSETEMTADSAQYTYDLIKAVLKGLSMTFEMRRQEVGATQARAELLTAITGTAEATYFFMGGDIRTIDTYHCEATYRRIAGLEMPRLELSDAAVEELLPLVMLSE